MRLSSRKFLLAGSAAAALYASRRYSEMVTVVLAYLGVEGLLDHKAAGSPQAPMSESV